MTLQRYEKHPDVCNTIHELYYILWFFIIQLLLAACVLQKISIRIVPGYRLYYRIDESFWYQYYIPGMYYHRGYKEGWVSPDSQPYFFRECPILKSYRMSIVTEPECSMCNLVSSRIGQDNSLSRINQVQTVLPSHLENTSFAVVLEIPAGITQEEGWITTT